MPKRPLSMTPEAIRKRRQRQRDAHLAKTPDKALPATLRKRNEPRFRLKPAEAAELVAKASREALARDRNRIEKLRSLPDVNNLEGRPGTGPGTPEGAEGLYIPREPGRGPARLNRMGAQAQARAIREHSKTLDPVNVGRARREQLINELNDSEQSSQYLQYMSVEQAERFQELSEQIASISLQALGILFDYAGGFSDYNSVIDRLTGSPSSIDVEEALSSLANLAQNAQLARVTYSERKIGRIR